MRLPTFLSDWILLYCPWCIQTLTSCHSNMYVFLFTQRCYRKALFLFVGFAQIFLIKYMLYIVHHNFYNNLPMVIHFLHKGRVYNNLLAFCMYKLCNYLNLFFLLLYFCDLIPRSRNGQLPKFVTYPSLSLTFFENIKTSLQLSFIVELRGSNSEDGAFITKTRPLPQCLSPAGY